MMHVYRNEDVDWVVAVSEDDAMDVWCESNGEEREDYPDEKWEQEPDDKVLTIQSDEGSEEKTCAEWVRLNGRGFLCSQNY